EGRNHQQLPFKLLVVCIWVVVGMIHSQSVQLSAIAKHIPADTQAAARIARVRRWLASKSVASPTLYDPLIREVVPARRGREVTIILDGCFIRHKTLQIPRVSLTLL